MSFWRFQQASVDYGPAMTGHYDLKIVFLSVLIACFAGYTALTISDRIRVISDAHIRRRWLLTGAMAMGTGIWAMHFTGMIAYTMHASINYSIPITLLSCIPAILGSSVALALLSAEQLNWRHNQISAFFMATCIALMHFTGMEAMQMDMVLRYDPVLFLLSYLVAHLLASVALYIKYIDVGVLARQNTQKKILSAIVMGCAVSGMHYTAMAAARFYPMDSSITPHLLFSTELLSSSIFVVVLLLLGVALTGIKVDKNFEQITKKLQHSRHVLNTFINCAPVMMWMCDDKGKALLFNNTWLQFSGRSLAEEIALDWSGIDIHPLDRESCIATYTGHIRSREAFDHEFRMKNAQGDYRWLREVGVPIMDENGNHGGFIGNCLDTTNRKLADAELRKLSQAVEQSASVVMISNIKGLIEYVNPKFTELTGYTPAEILGKSSQCLDTDDMSADDYADMRKTILAGKQWRGKFYNRKKDGSNYWSLNSISPVKNDTGAITHFISIQEDITREFELTERLSYQASHDVLTGLVNRREFERRLSQMFVQQSEHSDTHALCFIDLDQFKIINDTCGHIAGDELLKQVGHLLSLTVRKQDTLARIGGDEFALLLEHCPLSKAREIADTILDKVSNYQFIWEQRRFRIGVSIGLVITSNDITSPIELMKRADAACYTAKDLGRNRIHVYHDNDEAQAKIHGEMEWVARIYQALDENRFVLYAQPIVALGPDQRDMMHLEILLRMISEDGSIIPPGVFLPAAERYNIAPKLDRWVIETALTMLNNTPEILTQLSFCSINLSGNSLSDNDFLAYIITLLQASNIPAEKICFEITETAAIANLSTVLIFIRALKVLGCQFALDDFGSGLSSFAYLKSLPVDYLKIDGMFVREMVQNPIDNAMVKCINELAQVMGKQTIAEFVENDAIVACLQEIGVDYGQGYGIGKPQPFDEYLSMASASNLSQRIG